MDISLEQILKDIASTQIDNVPKEGLTFEQFRAKIGRGEKSSRRILKQLVADNKVEVVVTTVPDIIGKMNTQVYYVFR